MREHNDKIKTLLDCEYFRMDLEDGIVTGTYKSSFIDLPIAKIVVDNRLKAMNGQKYPVLIKLKSIKNSTKEARDFFASEKGCEGLTAAAFLIDSVLENMIAHLFIYLNKPVVPSKVFKDSVKAKEWLALYVGEGLKIKE